MKPADVRIFLECLGCKVPKFQDRSGWTVSNCPLGPWRHEGGKSTSEAFGIRDEQGDGFAYCFVCGFHGTQTNLLMEVSRLNKASPSGKTYDLKRAVQLVARAEETMEIETDFPDIETQFSAGQTKHRPFPEWWLESFQPVHKFAAAETYLGQRNVPEPVRSALDLRYDFNQKRVCFPVRDFGGKLMGLHGRVITAGVEPRYRMYLCQNENNPLIWLGEHWIDLDKPIVVVEGPFDLAQVYRVYRNVTSPLFASPSLTKLKRMSDAVHWITLYDRGTGGDRGRYKVDEFMTGKKKKNLTHRRPPAHRKDPGEMLIGEIVDVLEGLVDFDDFIFD